MLKQVTRVVNGFAWGAKGTAYIVDWVKLNIKLWHPFVRYTGATKLYLLVLSM